MGLDIIARGMAGRTQSIASSAVDTANQAVETANQAVERVERIIPVFKYKGSVSTYEDLPASGVELGDSYTTKDNGELYVVDSVSPLTYQKMSLGVDLYFN